MMKGPRRSSVLVVATVLIAALLLLYGVWKPGSIRQGASQYLAGHLASVTQFSQASEPSDSGVPGYTVLGRSDPDPVRWPGGFIAVDMQQQPDQSIQQQWRDPLPSCFDIATQVHQPLTSLYTRTRGPPRPLAGGAPRAFYRWDGNITRAEFDSVPAELPRGPNCVHCGPAVRYQIAGGMLYRRGGAPNWIVEVGEEVLLVALHLFQLPDMDFIVHYDDSCPPGGVPVLSWNICRDQARAGFAFPSYTAWRHALGPEQLRVYQQCLAARYPRSSRAPKVLWRGSTTDPFHSGFSIKDVRKVTRMEIHKRFEGDPVVDAQLSKVIFADTCTEQYLSPIAPPIDIEDFNRAAVILDVDGNGWSDRLSRLVQFPTPILKQASNHTAFFEHLLTPGHTMEYYENDLSDLKERADALVSQWKDRPEHLDHMTRQRQALAVAMMNTVAVAEAAAFSLIVFHSKTSWKFERDHSYQYVPFARVCHHNKYLPQQLCETIAKRPGPLR